MSGGVVLETSLDSYETNGSEIRVEYRPETTAERKARVAARRRALLAEARVWRKLGHWMESWPKRMNNDQITGVACFIANDSEVVLRMVERLVLHGGSANDPTHHHDQDYIAGLCGIFSAQCEDEASSLPAAPKKKQGRNA